MHTHRIFPSNFSRASNLEHFACREAEAVACEGRRAWKH